MWWQYTSFDDSTLVVMTVPSLRWQYMRTTTFSLCPYIYRTHDITSFVTYSCVTVLLLFCRRTAISWTFILIDLELRNGDFSLIPGRCFLPEKLRDDNRNPRRRICRVRRFKRFYGSKNLNILKFTMEQGTKIQRRNRGTALLFP
jgi:hypothetical protein